MNIGIDSISFYTAQYAFDLEKLAEARSVDPKKYLQGLGQERMSVAPPDEDAVTLGASAAHPLRRDGKLDDIDLLLFATESGVDQSKAGGLFIHGLLDLPSRCRVLEVKQACYSATAALQLAAAHVRGSPGRKALVIASDVARYELENPGEATQGCGAVAFTVAADPAVLALDPEAGYHAEDVMDFWRPNYRREALVDGKYSTRVYIDTMLHCWRDYAGQSGRGLEDFERFCYHLPFSRMAEKAQVRLARALHAEADGKRIEEWLEGTREYARVTGNCYAASLYVALTSLLDAPGKDLAQCRLGLFSYGSGCVGEWFSGVVQPGYRQALYTQQHRAMLANREPLTYRQYEDIYHFLLPEDGADHVLPQYRTGPYRLAGISNHKRTYEAVDEGTPSL
ncbi:hydroxymethylglutaryl-CoA synthase [Kiritimatiella glycovorans]|uniref:Hydroxymethylglutaryl-coenzyme A synthase n=1 Tax=Kiritimatiella glycovorans TaxID=1307763 RepID=A0A0G3EKP7_9BACT|nr:hydroxymethylglutaryl-CoA synthase [Kiritimatiella glycovorans]AKJ65330.1 Hydroxymethylglutaryl-coenzyme A synthase [Kiritimatiella glycovorans]